MDREIIGLRLHGKYFSGYLVFGQGSVFVGRDCNLKVFVEYGSFVNLWVRCLFAEWRWP